MKASLKVKLDQLLERYDDLAALLSDGETIADQNLFKAIRKNMQKSSLSCFVTEDTSKLVPSWQRHD